jgi:hypothetical protein
MTFAIKLTSHGSRCASGEVRLAVPSEASGNLPIISGSDSNIGKQF